MASRIAVIFGAGPGTGAAIARALAPTHSLVLLSRSLPGSLSRLALEDIPSDRVLAATFDGTGASFNTAIDSALSKWPDSRVDVGICHAGVSFAPGPFLERSTDDLRGALESCVSAWDFSQSVIKAMLDGHSASASKGTLIFTGATMARRAGANFSAMAPGSFARRALAQSLAREFGPKGVHVCHVVVDGLIATDRVTNMMGSPQEEGTRLEPEAIAETYLSIINQPPSVWTQELDIRPSKEKW